MTTIRTSPSGPSVDVVDPPITTDEVVNDSSVAGTTASDALETLAASVSGGLPAVLAANPNTGTNDIIVNAGQSVRFGASPAATGQIRATSTFLCRSTGSLSLTCDAGNAVMTATAGIASLVAGTSVGITGGTGVAITATTGNAVMTATAGIASLVAGTSVGITGGTGINATATTGNATMTATAGIASVVAGTSAAVTGASGAAVTATTGTASLTASAGAVNVTGNTNVTISATTGTATLRFTGQGTVDINSTSIQMTHTGAGNFSTAGVNQCRSTGLDMTVSGQTGMTTTAVTGGCTVQSLSPTGTTNIRGANNAGTLIFDSASAALSHTSGPVTLSAGTFVSVNNFLRFTEQAASTPSLGAGQGLFWVRNDAPNQPMFTDDTNVDRMIATASPLQSQVGWAPATGTDSNLLTLLPAGHPAGLYTIDYVSIIRTTATTGSALVPTLTWNSPGFGAESKTLQNGNVSAATGTLLASNGTSAGPKSVSIVSDGTAAITIRWNIGAITGNPVLDLYAGARLLAA